MKILQKSQTSNGVDIQIEDWSQDYSCFNYGETVVAYPVAISTNDNLIQYPKFKEKFRLEFDCQDYETALKVFESLKNGTKTLKDYINLVKEKEYINFI